jgi:glycogen synthase
MTQMLGRSLCRRGHGVRVIGIYPPGYPAPNFEIDEGVRIWRVRDSATHGSWISSRYRLYRRVAKWARERAIDIVEVPDYQGGAAGWKRLPVPVIGRLHGSLTYFARELGRPVDKLSFWLERAGILRFDYTCSVCNYTSLKTQQAFNLNRVTDAILYNSVEILAHSPEIPRSTNRVIYSGTLTEKKGILSLIEAWPAVVKSHPAAELHIFGKDGRTRNGQSMQEFLMDRLNGTCRTVRFHGHVPREQLFESFKTASVAVFPSHAEAFAIAPLEAMACGCPTIYSRRGSGSELMEEGHEGLLIDPDKPQEITEAILHMLSDPAFAKQLGDCGRARIRNKFSTNLLVDQNLTFYEQCLAKFRERHALRN